MLGNRILKELKKPTLMPAHSRPVHACVHAFTHGSTVQTLGKPKMLPSRISGIVLSDVTTIT